METNMIQDSHISESKFDKGLRITSNVFLMLFAIIFIIVIADVYIKKTLYFGDKFGLSCLNYIVLIYLIKFIMIEPKVCQIIIIIGIILTVRVTFYIYNKGEKEYKRFLEYPIFSFISQIIITSIMVISMCYVVYLYFIKEDQKLREHSHRFFVIFGVVLTMSSIATIVIFCLMVAIPEERSDASTTIT